MDEQMLARRAMSGDLNSFGQLYDTYFPRVYDFSWRLLLDADEAATVAEEVFDEAVRSLGTLREAPGVAPWLFAIAARRALPRAERRGEDAEPQPHHEEAFGAFGAPDPAAVRDRALLRGDDELPALIWEAATLLNARDYALLDLHLRQRLDGGELASVVNMNRSGAANLVARLTRVADDTFAAYVLARRGGRDCDGLREVLRAHPFPPYDEAARTAVEAHVAECERCKSTRAAMPAMTEVFAALAAVEAPLALKADVWRNIAAVWGSAHSAASFAAEPEPAAAAAALALASDGGADRPGGFTLGAGGEGEAQRPWILFAGAVGGMLLFAFLIGGVVMALNGGDDADDAGAVIETPTAGVSETAEPGETNVPGVDVEESPTPDVTATETPAPTETPPPPPPATPTPPPPPPATPTPNIRTVGPPPSPTSPPAQQTATPPSGATAVPTP